MASSSSPESKMNNGIRTSATTSAITVLLYIPNLIGYIRILFSTAALLLMSEAPSFWLLAIALYVTSFVADLFDGWAARKWNQCSDFGGLLDMITDRCSTAGLLHVLSFEYSHLSFYRVMFLGLMILDLSSHWCQLHHKSTSANANRFFLVRWYYGYYYFFGYLCVGAEFTYMCMYALAHTDDSKMIFMSSLLKLTLKLCLPGCVMKQIVNVCQGFSACWDVAHHDAQHHNVQRTNKKLS